MFSKSTLRRHRGQALVLFALFVLILVMATMATMSLAHLTHQKMELQVASDTAAYSQAVATARAFNSVALLNRAQVSTMVALAGVDSAVSYASAYRAALNATWYSYAYELDVEYCSGSPPLGTVSFPPKLCDGNIYSSHRDCRWASHGMDSHDRQIGACYGDTGNGYGSTQATRHNACEVWLNIYGWGAIPPAITHPFNNNARMPLMRVEFDRIKAVWQTLDDAAGLQARNVQSEAFNYNDLEAAALGEARVKVGTFPGAALAAVPGASANPPSLGIAQREYSAAVGGGDITNSLEAAMGSRAHPFITLRTDGARALEEQIERVLAPSGASPDEVTLQPLTGNGYFATAQSHGARPATTFAAWGDDHSWSSSNYLGPGASSVPTANPGISSRPLRFEAWVQSTDEQDTVDKHSWCPEDFEPEAVPPDERHTLHPHTVPAPPAIDECAGSSCIWPAFYDTNAGLITEPLDVYGQPKMLVAATKNLVSKDPWNFFFRFRFSQTGPGQELDFRDNRAVAGVVPSLQTIAAGMAYYHRPGHWQEPPNLFNPYWRATLVRANVDASGVADIGSSITPANRDALNLLIASGYRGIP